VIAGHGFRSILVITRAEAWSNFIEFSFK